MSKEIKKGKLVLGDLHNLTIFKDFKFFETNYNFLIFEGNYDCINLSNSKEVFGYIKFYKDNLSFINSEKDKEKNEKTKTKNKDDFEIKKKKS